MAGYPDDVLDAKVELLLGDTWTDITDWAMPDGINDGTITGGQPDGAQQPNPASLPAIWDNPDGRFSPRNKSGPWYGQLRQNTPARVSVASPYGNYLRAEDSIGWKVACPDVSALRITGNLDARLDLDLSDYRASDLMGNWTNTGGTLSWLLTLQDDGTLIFWWSTDGTALKSAVSLLPLPSGRLALRVTFQPSTGTVTWYTGASGGAAGSTWAQLGDPVIAGATTLHGGTNGLFAGGYYGATYRAVIMSGIAGTTVASPDFTAQDAGVTSFADAESNTWTVSAAEISDRDYRLYGELSSIIPTVATSSGQAQAATTISGLLRRLQQGEAPPSDSPIKRAIITQAGSLAPVAYWPCEDTAGAPSFGPAVGAQAMLYDSAPDLASDGSFACSQPLPQLNGSRWHAKVDAYTASGGIIVRFLAKLGTLPASNAVLVRLGTTGRCREVSLRAYTGGALGLAGYDATGANVFDTGAVAFAAGGQALEFSIELLPSGTTLDYNIVTLAPGLSTGNQSPGTVASTSIGSVTDIWVNPSAFFTDTVFGQLQVQAAWVSMFSLFQPLEAWAGELDSDRFARIAAEEGLGVRIYGSPGRGVAMGAQATDTAWNLLQECAKTGQSLIYEPREALAVGYRTAASMCNQSPAAVLSYTGKTLPGNVQAADDDLDLVNDWTVQNNDGTSFRALVDDGSPTSISDPEDGGAGHYANTDTANAATPGVLMDSTGWRLNLSTADEARYRQVTADFGIPGAPAADLARVRPGDLLEIDDPPAVLQTDDIRQIATGITEVLGPGRTITWDCMPASPWDVMILDDDTFGRWDTESELHADIDDSVTSIEADATGTPAIGWTTDSDDWPFRITIGGEDMDVTAVTGADGTTQTLTVIRGVNGITAAHSAGDDIRLAVTPRYAFA